MFRPIACESKYIEWIITSDIRRASSPGIIVKQSVEVTCKSGTVLTEIHFEKKKLKAWLK